MTDDEPPLNLHVHVEPHEDESEEDPEEEKENVEIFNSFCQCLQTADGGRKDKKMAKQHCSQVRKILVTIDPKKT